MAALEGLRRLNDCGYSVATYSPGDGATRYKITRPKEDYFAASLSAPTALGRKAAQAMVWHFIAGCEAWGAGR